MTDYTEPVAALRILQDKNSLSYYKQVCKDAADAIEALNRLVDLNTERCEGLLKQLREAQEQYEKHLNELEQQLPKRGEWKKWADKHGMTQLVRLVCSECGKDIVVSKENIPNYCPNCGAKMEVQDGK